LADSANNPSLNNKHFLADGVFSAQAIKVNNHWRISELKNDVVWRTGDEIKEVLNFGRSQNYQRIANLRFVASMHRVGLADK